MRTENSELIYRYICIHIYEWEKTHRKIKWSPLRIRCMNSIPKPYGTKCVFISANLCRSFENRISFVDHIRSIEICGDTHISRILWTFRHHENEATENEKRKIKMKQIEEEIPASESVNCLKQWTKKKKQDSNGENKMTDESFMCNLAIALKQNNQTVGEKKP